MRWKLTIPGFRARGFANSNATAPMSENVAQHPRVRKLQCGVVWIEALVAMGEADDPRSYAPLSMKNVPADRSLSAGTFRAAYGLMLEIRLLS